MKAQMQLTIKEMEEQSQQEMTDLIERSGDELSAALEEIIAKARTTPVQEDEEK